MSTKRNIVLTIALLAFLLAAATGLAVAAWDPDLGWRVVAGGGGHAASAGYQVDGTAGQEAAGLLAGGAYELGSGFWGGGELVRAHCGIHLPVIVRSR